MNAQTLTFPMMTYNFIVALPEQPICASSRDYGFDFDEEEIARELVAPLPTRIANLPAPEMKAEEVERIRYYFS